ncbi:MAG: hypothetical protein IGBAC_0150 [Ignavibacteriae bacterium]|nr:MAG: hypothetical protein IGBAC_0150 [Ignavibacteriota bacterium]
MIFNTVFNQSRRDEIFIENLNHDLNINPVGVISYYIKKTK